MVAELFRLLRLFLGVFHDDFVGIAGAEILVQGNRSFEGGNVPDGGVIVGRDRQIVIARIAGAVLEVDSVFPHDCAIDFRDLAPD